MQLADSATDYLSKKIKSNNNFAFVALIEQMIHVPEGNQAYYGGVLAKSNLDVILDKRYSYPDFVYLGDDVKAKQPDNAEIAFLKKTSILVC